MIIELSKRFGIGILLAIISNLTLSLCMASFELTQNILFVLPLPVFSLLGIYFVGTGGLYSIREFRNKKNKESICSSVKYQENSPNQEKDPTD